MQVVSLKQPNDGTAKRNGKPSLWFGLVNTCTLCLWEAYHSLHGPGTPGGHLAIRVPASCAKIERRTWRLQPYHITVKYRRGETNPADYLSQHPTTNAAQIWSSRRSKVWQCSPFNSKDFASFADDLGFKHRKVTPK